MARKKATTETTESSQCLLIHVDGTYELLNLPDSIDAVVEIVGETGKGHMEMWERPGTKMNVWFNVSPDQQFNKAATEALRIPVPVGAGFFNMEQMRQFFGKVLITSGEYGEVVDGEEVTLQFDLAGLDADAIKSITDEIQVINNAPSIAGN